MILIESYSLDIGKLFIDLSNTVKQPSNSLRTTFERPSIAYILNYHIKPKTAMAGGHDIYTKKN